MNPTTFLTAVLLAAVLAIPAAPAAAAGYLSVSGGASIFPDGTLTLDGFSGSAKTEYDPGVGFSVAGGAETASPVRLEAEFGYKKADIKRISGSGGSTPMTDSSVTAKSLLFNGYWDLDREASLSPFLGAGAGIVNVDVELNGDSRDDTLFAYQATAGLAWRVDNHVNLDLYYRYLGAASDFSREGVHLSWGSHNVYAGVRYRFH